MPPPSQTTAGVSLSSQVCVAPRTPAACASASAARQKGAAHIKTAHVLHF
jgi:hypothetical protein